MSILFADSNCDLNSKQMKQFGIEYINMPFSLSEEGLELLSVDHYEEVFAPYLQQGNNLIYVHQSEKYLKSLPNIKKAIRRLKTEYPDNTITLVDSKSTSSGYAYIVYQSVLKYKTGCSDTNLVNFIKKVRNEVLVLFSMNNTNKLIQNGIDIKVENALIKPIVKLENDEFEVVGKVTNRKKMYSTFIEAMEKYGENIADYPIFISYSGSDIEANELKLELENYIGENAKVLVNKVNPYDEYYLGNKGLTVAFHKK